MELFLWKHNIIVMNVQAVVIIHAMIVFTIHTTEDVENVVKVIIALLIIVDQNLTIFLILAPNVIEKCATNVSYLI